MVSISPVVDVLADVVGWEGSPKYLPDWSVTERLLGLPLPDDYKALLRTIPMGTYAGVVSLAPPTLTGHEGELMAGNHELMKALRADRDCPYPLHPDVPGLIPWAEFDAPTTGVLFWLADQGDPNQWPVVLWGAEDIWEEYDVGAAAFLLALVRNKVPSEVLKPKPGAAAYVPFQDLPGLPNNTGR